MKKKLSHSTVPASFYDDAAENYDAFNEERSAVINGTIEEILKKQDVKTVLDLACGTGSQVFWLAKRGHEVVGVDINKKMLDVARKKLKKEELKIQFIEGDMRTSKIGKFDAVITIFNAVGHLTKADFEKAMCNVYKNLIDGGLYIFDINNLSYLLENDNITKLTIDWLGEVDGYKIRKVQYSTITQDGILASHTTYYDQSKSKEPIFQTQTLQTYTVDQLTDMLKKAGFKVLSTHSIDGSSFRKTESDCIFMVAKK